VTVQQKHQNRNANLKKRETKIKKHENQRQIKNRGRKRELKREGISTQYKPLGKKSDLNSTNLWYFSACKKLYHNPLPYLYCQILIWAQLPTTWLPFH
jgi:hypothetical protein